MMKIKSVREYRDYISARNQMTKHKERGDFFYAGYYDACESIGKLVKLKDVEDSGAGSQEVNGKRFKKNLNET